MVSANNAIYNTVGASISGVTNTFTVTNPSNTASSAARETITVGGGTAADPTMNWNVSGVTDWEMGIDNSDSDKWKLSQGTALGTNDTITAFTTGNILKPRNCAFSAYLSVTVNNVTGDGTVYTIICDTELNDIGGNYNNATGIFTAPVTGNYMFCAGANLINMNAAHTGVHFHILTIPISFQIQGWQNNTYIAAISAGSIIVPLVAGNTVQLNIDVTAGSKTVGLFGGPDANTFFSGYLLG